MQYGDLVGVVSEKTKLSKEKVDQVLKQFAGEVVAQCRNGSEVHIPQFGRFTKKVMKPMKVPVKPGSKETREVTPKPTIRFTASKTYTV
jgi:nucleoid DNA-binding protein